MHFNLDPEDINNPWHAAIASFLAFSLGGIIPFLTIILTPPNMRIVATIAAVVLALFVVGYLSAKAGNADKVRAIARVVVGGIAAMIITYGVGVLFGTTVG